MKTNKRISKEGISAEHDAINQYNQMLKQTKDPYTKKVIRHINKDEREHVKEFRALSTRVNKTANKPVRRTRRSKSR